MTSSEIKKFIGDIICTEAPFQTLLPIIDRMKSDRSNWDYFITIAQEEKVIPLLYFSIKQKKIDKRFPESVVAFLEASYVINMKRSFLFKNDLLKVLHILSHNQIDIMILKGGVHFFEKIYPDINTRTMFDIDLMVKSDQIPQINRIFSDQGFKCERDPWNVKDKMNFLKDIYNYEIHPSPFIEARTNLLSPEGMWEKARPRHFGNASFFIPSPSDMLFHCIIHDQLQHGHLFECQLSTLYEVERMIGSFHDEIDWTEFFHRAKRHRLEIHIAIFLQQLNKLKGATLPRNIADLFNEALSQLDPFVRQIKSLSSFKGTGKKYFNYVIIYKTKRRKMNKYFSFFVLSTFRHVPRDNISKYYRFFPVCQPFTFFLKLIYVLQSLLLQAVFGNIIINKRAKKAIQDYLRYL